MALRRLEDTHGMVTNVEISYLTTLFLSGMKHVES